jgi:drug/metabolite transporter (DMT)-like permease
MQSITPTLIFSMITAAISGIFASIVLKRWWDKRREGHPAPHLMAWGVGLALYFLGSFSQTILAFVWSPLFFGLYYWSGALATAAWLGQGTTYLLIRRGNIARNIHMALLLVCAMTLPWTLFLTPFDGNAWHPGVDITTIVSDVSDSQGNLVVDGIMPEQRSGTVRAFSPIMNIWGTIALAGGAIYSAWLFGRKQIMRNRVVGNWLIAAGALFPAAAGAFIRLNFPILKYPAEMIGIILIFAGFLLATNVPEETTVKKRESTPEAAG